MIGRIREVDRGKRAVAETDYGPPRYLRREADHSRHANSVELILSLLAQGESEEAILEDYPDLEPEDIRACIAYAHAVIARDTLDAIEVTK
jgi:hypothetical protein